MPIQFPCEGCSRPLSAPDDKAGKLAICPECGARLRVPGGNAPSRPQVTFESLPESDAGTAPGDRRHTPPNVFRPANLGESETVHSRWNDDDGEEYAATDPPVRPPLPPRSSAKSRRRPAPPRDEELELIDDDVVESGFQCRYCKSRSAPRVKQQISTGGWIVFAAFLIACFPLCFIGLFMKEDQHFCRDCGIRLDRS